MPGRLQFETFNLHSHGGLLHFHGCLQVKIGETVIDYPNDVCINDWVAALANLRQEIIFSNRGGDPTAFFIDGQQSWPVLETIRMADSLRIAMLHEDVVMAKCLISIPDFEVVFEEFLDHLAERAHLSHGDGRHRLLHELSHSRCEQFWSGKAGEGAPPGWEDS